LIFLGQTVLVCQSYTGDGLPEYLYCSVGSRGWAQPICPQPISVQGSVLFQCCCEL